MPTPASASAQIQMLSWFFFYRRLRFSLSPHCTPWSFRAIYAPWVFMIRLLLPPDGEKDFLIIVLPKKPCLLSQSKRSTPPFSTWARQKEYKDSHWWTYNFFDHQITSVFVNCTVPTIKYLSKIHSLTPFLNIWDNTRIMMMCYNVYLSWYPCKSSLLSLSTSRRSPPPTSLCPAWWSSYCSFRRRCSDDMSATHLSPGCRWENLHAHTCAQAHSRTQFTIVLPLFHYSNSVSNPLSFCSDEEFPGL